MNERNQIIESVARAEVELTCLNQARDRAALELEKLRSKLAELTSATNNPTSGQLTKYTPLQEKVQLFASLFRGRDDVFARLWSSQKTGKKGYSPVCEYEWQPGICTKPEVKCSNCKFYKAQHQRRSTFQIPRIISCTEEFPKHLAVPRGCLEPLRALLDPLEITIEIGDERFHGIPREAEFHGKLNAAQQNAITQISPHEIGIFVAPPGSGKTVVGIYLIAQRRLSTLVLVHRKPLLEQWHSQLTEFLNLPPEQIGCIGGGKDSRTRRIDVAMLQSLVRKGEVDPHFSLCQFLSKAKWNNTPVEFCGRIRERQKFGFMITSTVKFRCWRACSRSGSKRIGR